ncbi:hypothetical protein E2C01_056522 [Portunus trituberculatus]|uniref:Uncharacterized protein n=1 Tax=Portunus trituberculatus TaxID=210409 RepID=A0A5B7GZE7_PORTR|nr:hypothetical protein [Portunus trituberculatus]
MSGVEAWHGSSGAGGTGEAGHGLADGRSADRDPSGAVRAAYGSSVRRVDSKTLGIESWFLHGLGAASESAFDGRDGSSSPANAGDRTWVTWGVEAVGDGSLSDSQSSN